MRATGETATAVDFARSSVMWMLPEQPSYGWFALDAALTVRTERFVLAAQVFAGDVYSDGPMLRAPPYAFSAAFSRRHYRIFRDAACGASLEDTTGLVAERFRELHIDVRRTPCRILSVDELVGGPPTPEHRFVARLRVAGADARPGYELEFPLRHMNVNPARQRFQAETGPVLTLDSDTETLTAQLRRAYVIFSRCDRAELLLDAPRPAEPGQRWQQRIELSCAIELLAIKA